MQSSKRHEESRSPEYNEERKHEENLHFDWSIWMNEWRRERPLYPCCRYNYFENIVWNRTQFWFYFFKCINIFCISKKSTYCISTDAPNIQLLFTSLLFNITSFVILCVLSNYKVQQRTGVRFEEFVKLGNRGGDNPYQLSRCDDTEIILKVLFFSEEFFVDTTLW